MKRIVLGILFGWLAFSGVALAQTAITISPCCLDDGFVGAAYSEILTASGGSGPYEFTIATGGLPPGLTLETTGELHGLPTTTGSYGFLVVATDQFGSSGSRNYSMDVLVPPTLDPPTLPGATVGQFYSQQLQVLNPVSVYDFYVTTGSLPPGLSLSTTGLLSGRPTSFGSFDFTISAIEVVGLEAATATATVMAGPPPVKADYTLVVAPAITLLPLTLPDGSAGTPYAEDLFAGGGTAPYNIHLVTGTLPPGLTIITLSADQARLDGTPTTPGDYAFQLGAMDTNGYFTINAYDVSIAEPAITVSPPSVPPGTVHSAYSVAFSASGGTAPYTFTIDTPPPGLALAADGTLAGTPTSDGSFAFDIVATDANGSSGSSAYTLLVDPPQIDVTPASLPDGMVGTPYNAVVNASGGLAPYTFEILGALPDGLVLDASTGEISGTPDTQGTFVFSVKVVDVDGHIGSWDYTVAIAAPAITVSPPSVPPGTVHSAYSVAFSASGGTAPYTFAIDAAPPGLSLSPGGTLSGTPTSDGSFGFTIVATDANGSSGSSAYTLLVDPPQIDVTPASLPDGMVGTPYNAVVSASGGLAPYTFETLGALPDGLVLDALTGEISGTPDTQGKFVFSVKVVDADGHIGSWDYTVAIAAPAITVSPPSVPPGTVHSAYSVAFSASGGTAPYTFAIDAAPPGLSLSPGGTLSGTPTSDGSFGFTIVATDANGATGDLAYVLDIGPPTITLSPTALPEGMLGVPYAETISAGGGLAPYTFSAAGSLPDGLALDPGSGSISGTPTSAGSFSFMVVATDADGHAGSWNYDVAIAAPTITVSPSSVAPGTVHSAYSATFSASGGTAPYTFAIDAAPPGLSLSPGGTLSGTPTSDGSFGFTIVATDANGATGEGAYTLEVDPPHIEITPASLPDGTVGTPYSAVIAATGGLAPYTFEHGGDLPDGLILDVSSGVLSGTPASEGNFSFSVQASDADGHSAVQAYLVTIPENAPVAVDDSASTVAQQAVAIDVVANDSGAIDAIAITDPPSHGSASVDGLSILYTPAGTFFGDDSFHYTASGPGGVSAPATVTVHVAPLPVPVGVPQSLQVLAGNPVTFDAAAGASGGPITAVTIVQPPAIGIASVAGTLVTYSAPADGAGVQQVGYVLSNAYGDSAPVISTIAIDPAPVAPEVHATTPMGIAVELDLTSGASGGPFVDATILEVAPAGAGTAMLLDDGDGAFRLRFTPGDAFVGDASVGFTLSNAHATSAPGTAVITVTERDDPTRNPEVGGIIQSQVFTVREFVQAQIDNVHNRLEELHDFEPGDRPWGFWIGGSLRHGDRDGNGAVAPASFETSGLTSGADYRFSERFAFGAALGHGRDRTAIGNEGSRSDGRAESATGYGSFKPSSLPFYVDGMAGHQRITFQLQRVDPATGEIMSVPREGVQSYSSWASGYEHKADTWMIGTYGRMDVSQARLDAYEEQGSPLQALAFEEMAIQTRVSTLGLRGRFRHKIRWGTLEPKFRIEFQRDFHDATGAVIRYADQAGGNQVYVVPGSGLDRNRAIIELGGVLRTFGGMVLRLDLRSVRGGPNDSDNAISFSFQDDH